MSISDRVSVALSAGVATASASLPAVAEVPTFTWTDVTGTLALIATQVAAFGVVLVAAVAAIAVIKYVMAVIV